MEERLAKKDQANPPDWGEDALADFIEAGRINTLATFQRITQWYGKLRDIDGIFLILADHLDNPSDQRAPFFFYLCHGAFRAAVRLAMGAQLPPTYMVLRGSLESALYGHFIHRHSATFDVWRKRGEDDASRTAVRRTFTTAAVFDVGEHIAAKALYERTIDHGAHPNELALFGALSVDQTEETLGFEVAILPR
jgi:hypothetical protein